jgi:hypothetical protein
MLICLRKFREIIEVKINDYLIEVFISCFFWLFEKKTLFSTEIILLLISQKNIV